MRICDDQSPSTLQLNANLSIQFVTRNYFYESEIVCDIVSDNVDA